MNDMLRFVRRFNHATAGDEAPPLLLPDGSEARILTSGAQTDGRLTVVEYLGRTRGDPPPFTRHAFIEVFCIMSGRLRFQFLNEDPFTVQAGSAINVTGGNAHTFWNPDATPVRILLACAPAGLDEFFRRCSVLSERRDSERLSADDITAELERIRLRCGVEEVAPPPVPG